MSSFISNDLIYIYIYRRIDFKNGSAFISNMLNNAQTYITDVYIVEVLKA